MVQVPTVDVPKWALTLLNNLYELERKLILHGDVGNALRNVERMKAEFEDQRLFFEDPMGAPFKETRTDLDATITGSGTENLRVVEVIKPIIRLGEPSLSRVVQRGIVLVQSEDSANESLGEQK